MRKKTTFNIISNTLLGVIFLFNSALAQDMKIIKLDYKDKKNEPFKNELKNIKKGDLYQLQISGINMNLYNVNIDKKDSIIQSEVKFPTFDMIGLDAVNSLIGGIINSTSSQPNPNVEKIKVLQDRKTSLIYENIALQKEVDEIHKNEIVATTKLNLIKKKGLLEPKLKSLYNAQYFSDTVQLISDLENYTIQRNIVKQFLNEKKEENEEIIEKLNSAIKELNELSKSNFSKRFEEEVELNKNSIKNLLIQSKIVFFQIDTLFFKLNLLSVSYFDQNNEHKCNFVNDPEIKFETIIQKTNIWRKELSDLLQNITELKDKYSDFILLKEISYLLKKDGDSLRLRKLNEDLLTSFDKTINTLKDKIIKISEDKLIANLRALIYLENNATNEYKSLPMQFNGDISSLKIKITPKKEEFGLQSYQTELKFPNKKMYVGVGASFYFGYFKNQSYSIKETKLKSDSSSFKLVQENPSVGEIGFASLLHIGWKPCDIFGLNVTVGPALSLTNKSKARLSVGGGFTLGKERSLLSFDFLSMYGYVDRLSNVYDTESSYSKSPEQVTISRLANSLAIAIGYIYKF